MKPSRDFATPDQFDAAPASGTGFGVDLLGLVLKAKWWLAVGLVAGLAVGEIAYLQLGPAYQAAGRILVTKRSTVPINKDGDTLNMVGERGEHVALIMSPMIVGQAVKRFKLNELPSLSGESDPVGKILSSLRVKRTAGSDRSFINILDVSYESPMLNEAPQVVDAIIQSYKAYLSESHQNNAAEAARLVKQANDELLKQLQVKQDEYLAFRKRTPILWRNAPGTDGQAGDMTNVHQERVFALEAERRVNLLKRTEVKSKLEMIQKERDQGTSPATVEILVRRYLTSEGNNSLVPLGGGGTEPGGAALLSILETRILPLILDEKKLLRDYGPDHPEVKSVRRSLQTTIEFYEKQGLVLPDLESLREIAATRPGQTGRAASAVPHRPNGLGKGHAPQPVAPGQTPAPSASVAHDTAGGASVAATPGNSAAQPAPAGKTGDSRKPFDIVAAYIESLQKQLEELIARDRELEVLAKIEGKAAQEFSSYQLEDQKLNDELKRIKALWELLVTRLNELNLSKENGGYVLKTLSEPQQALNLKRQLKIIGAGGVAGVLLAFALAYARAYRDTRVKDVAEVQQLLGLQVIGRVPEIDFENAPAVIEGSSLDPTLYYFHNPGTPEAEAYRSVRSALYVCALRTGDKIIQVTSPEPQDGKSTLIANLAIAIAQSGKRVLMIDADLRCPKIHLLYGLADDYGLSDVLTGELDVTVATQTTEVEGLFVLAAGPIPRNPAELLTSQQFHQLLEDLRQQYDYILVDSPPLLAVSDPCIIAPQSDGLLLVVRLGKNRRHAVRRAEELLRTHNVCVLGVVANGVPRSPEEGNGYGYYAYSNNSYFNSTSGGKAGSSSPEVSRVVMSEEVEANPSGELPFVEEQELLDETLAAQDALAASTRRPTRSEEDAESDEDWPRRHH